MSFEFTDKEKLRVIYASLIGVKLDHISYYDLAVIIAWAIIYIIHLPLVIYMVAKHKYPPLASISPTMCVFYIGAMVWFVGDVLTNEMVHPVTRPLQNCVLTTIWLRSILGQALVFNVILYKATLCWFKHKYKRRVERSYRWAIIGTMVAYNLAVGVIITVLPADMTVKFVPVLDICQFTKAFKNTTMVLTWANWTASFGCVLGSNPRAHRDVQRLFVACIALLAALVLHTTIYYKKPMYPASLAWRITIVSADMAAALIAWWLVSGSVIYNSLRRPSQYLIEWYKENGI
ncbi:hypothetical protein BX070DRAFT_252438 [Coemansia spiralis]|nr:hypothetical protein BX070DRAFT_252438 [Coemansia spiralis]